MPTEIVKIELDFGNGKEQFEEVTQASKRFGESLEGIRLAIGDTQPGVTQFLDTTEDSFMSSAKFVERTQKALDNNKIQNYKKEDAVESVKNRFTSMDGTVADMRRFAEIATTLNEVFKTTPQLLQTYQNVLPSLKNEAKRLANEFVNSGDVINRGSLLRVLPTSKKTEIQSFNEAVRAAKLTDDQIKNMYEYAALTAIPQYQRHEFMKFFDKAGSSQKHVYSSFRDMLPQTFANIPSTRSNRTKETFDSNYASDTLGLSQAETEKLEAEILKNRYLTDAAVAVGAMKKENGTLIRTSSLNRGLVNAMAGVLMEDLVIGAKGMERYGIKDVEDPNVWHKIARKTNKQMLGSLDAARMLESMYGEWLTPDYYSQDQVNELLSKTNSVRVKLDKLDFSPRTKSFEVARYTADDIAKGRSWNNGATYSDADNYHRISVDDSIQMRTIMKHGSGIKPHNSYTDDVVYYEIDPRLDDPNTDEETRKKIKADIAKVWEEGFSVDGPDGNKIQYTATRANPKMGIEFVKKEIFDSIQREDASFWGGGLTKDVFNTGTEFAAAMEYRNKNATSGEDLRDLFGVEFFADGKKPNIAVVNIPGLDGASMVNSRLVQSGFQGRMHGVKSALMPVDFGKVAQEYQNAGMDQVEFNRVTGDGKVRIDESVDLLLNAADIKNFNARFAGKSYDEIVGTITDDLQKYGMSALRTYSDAGTKTRWISAQLAQTMTMSDEDVRLFNKAFFSELQSLNTVEGVKRALFSGDSEAGAQLEKNPWMINTRAIQTQIDEYRKNMIHRKSRGDIVLPKDVNAHKLMAAPWVVDVFNAGIEDAGGVVPKSMEALSLIKKNDKGETIKENVAFFSTLAQTLGLSRYPAAPGSVQIADNAAVGEGFKKFAQRIGLDLNGLYMAPGSKLMEYMQGEDFDGDVNEIIEFAGEEGSTASSVIEQLFRKAQESGNKIVNSMKKEDLKARDEGLKRELEYSKNILDNKYHVYGKGSGAQVAEFIENYRKSSIAMGVPNAVLRNAYQMRPGEVQQAMLDAIRQYDINSVQGKKGVFRETSQEERDVLTKYKPFSEFFHMIDKATGEDGYVDYEQLRSTNLWKINMPSATPSGNMMSALMTRFFGKRMGYDINEGYDWNRLFDKVGGEYDKNTAIGQMQDALKSAYMGYLNADYLALSDTDMFALRDLKRKAIEEAELQAAKDIAADTLSEEESKYLSDYHIQNLDAKIKTIAGRRVNARGGTVIDNLLGYGINQGKMEVQENQDSLHYLESQLYDMGFRTADVVSSLGQYDRLKTDGSKPVLVASGKHVLSPDAVGTRRATLNESRDLLSNDEIRNKLDEATYSPTSLISFANDPESWMLRVLDPKKADPFEDTDSTILGKATHSAIQKFMKARQNAAASGAQLDENQLKAAANEALSAFDKYLEYGNKKEKYGGVSKSSLSDMREGVGALGESYVAAKSWIQNELINFMDESKYKVVAIERTRNYDKAGFGHKRKHENEKDVPEELKARGRTDLEFVDRETGERTIVDIKTHHARTSPEAMRENLQKAIHQLQSYALSDEAVSGAEGEKIAGAKVQMPVQGKVEDVDISEEAQANRKTAIEKSIKQIQSLSESDLSYKTLQDASKVVGMYLLGAKPGQEEDLHYRLLEIEKSRKAEEEQADRMNVGFSEAAIGTLGGVLTSHEDYKDAMEDLQGINSFIYKKTRDSDDASFDPWASYYNRIDAAQQDAKVLRRRNMLAEADRLSSTADSLKDQQDSALIKSATEETQKFAESLHAVNEETPVSKDAQKRIEFYKDMNKQAQTSLKAQKTMGKRIDQLDEEIKRKQKQYAREDDVIADEKATEEDRAAAREKRASLKREIEGLQDKRDYFMLNRQKAEESAKQAQKELDIFNSKYPNKVQGIYEELSTSFSDVRSGTVKSGVTSIKDDKAAYKKEVRQAMSDLQQMEKSGMFKGEKEHERYSKLFDELKRSQDKKALDKYEKTLIKESLEEASGRMLKLRESITGEPVSDQYKIDAMVKQKSAEVLLAKLDLEKRFDGVALGERDKKRYKEMLSFYESFNEDDYRKRLTEMNEYEKKEQEARRQYEDEALRKSRENKISAMKERLDARRSGIPVSKYAAWERDFQSQIAAEEESIRRLESDAGNMELAAEERERAKNKAAQSRSYVDQLKFYHDEELRSAAELDIADTIKNFEKSVASQGVSSSALDYVKQFEQLTDSIEEATSAYNALKAKIDSNAAEGKPNSQEDLDALSKAEDLLPGLSLAALNRKDQLRQLAADSYGKQIGELESFASVQPKTIDEQTEEYVKQYADKREAIVKSLEYIIANDPDSEAKLNPLLNKAREMDFSAASDQYKNKLLLDRESQQAKVDELHYQQRELDRRRNPFRIQSPLDRAEAYRRQMIKQYRSQKMSLMQAISQEELSAKAYTGKDDNQSAIHAANVKSLREDLEKTEATMKKLSGSGGKVTAMFGSMAQAAAGVFKQFGTRMFHKAMQEVVQFTRMFDQNMTNIQMVSGKTDEQIRQLGSELIDLSIDMKVSVEDVTSAASDLYRQGLTDEEVSVRLEDVIKFSKVAGIKTQEASEILTAAQTNGLATTTTEVMDAMVALGDSAATDASEISKGLKKSAASAVQAGMTLSELTTMLTIITSKTQLGGNVAGTALQTMLYRMYKVGSGEDFYDENGKHIAATRATEAFGRFGVDLFDEEGNFRGPYQVLTEVAQRWDDADDITQEFFLSTMGAGRQRSNIATLMQGLGEDGGELANKYMDLASNSEGITDRKYQDYADSLQASLDNVTSSFDKLVNAMNTGLIGSEFLNFLAELIQGLAAAEESFHLVSVAIGVFGAALLVSNPHIAGLLAIVAAVTGVVSLIGHIGTAATKAQEPELTMEDVRRKVDNIAAYKERQNAQLDRLAFLDKKENKTEEETAELREGIAKLSKTYDTVASAAKNASGEVGQYADAIERARKETEAFAETQFWEIIKTDFKKALPQYQGVPVLNNDTNPFFSDYTPSSLDSYVSLNQNNLGVGIGEQAAFLNKDRTFAELFPEGTLDFVYKAIFGEDYDVNKYNDKTSFYDVYDAAITNGTSETKLAFGRMVDFAGKYRNKDKNSLYEQMWDIAPDLYQDEYLGSITDEKMKKMLAPLGIKDATTLRKFVTDGVPGDEAYANQEKVKEFLPQFREDLSKYLLIKGAKGVSFDPFIQDDLEKNIPLIVTDLISRQYPGINETAFTKTFISNVLKARADNPDATVFDLIPAEFYKVADFAQKHGPEWYNAYYDPDLLIEAQNEGYYVTTPFRRGIETADTAYELDETVSKKRIADSTYEGITKQVGGSDAPLEKLLDMDLASWDAFATNFPEQVKILKDAQEEDGKSGYKVKEGVDQKAIYAQFMAGVANASLSYAGSDPFDERYLLGNAVRTIFNDIGSVAAGESIDLKGIDEDILKPIIGEGLYGKIKLYNDAVKAGKSPDVKDYLRPEELEYASALIDSYMFGRDGLFEENQNRGSQWLISMLTSGRYAELSSYDPGMISAYSEGISGFPELMRMMSYVKPEYVKAYYSDDSTSIEKHSAYTAIATSLEEASISSEHFFSTISKVNKELASNGVRAARKYGDLTDRVADNMDQWADTAGSVATAIKEVNAAATSASKDKYYADRYLKGERDNETVEYIASMVGLDKNVVKVDPDGGVSTQVKAMLDAARENVQVELSAFDTEITEMFKNNPIVLDDLGITVDGGAASVDLSDVAARVSGLTGDQLKAIAAMLSHLGLGAHVQITGDGDNIKAEVIVDWLNSGGYKGSGGGGGGGGKSKAGKLLDKHKRKQTMREHIIQMIQYEETKYQNAGELSNYGIMLGHEIDEEKRQAEELKKEMAEIREEMAGTKEHSDDWYDQRDALLEAEEAYEDMTIKIQENEKALEENRQEILKLHTELESEVKQEIETRIQEERSQLDATVSMEEMILEAIRERYRKEWELMQEDIEKKKEALQEEMDLIDKRLSKRKDAEDEAAKYEELAELKRQLAMVSMDSTRTKDQAELRNKISELEKDISWGKAEDEAEAQKEQLQEQSDAYDEYTEEYQKYLDDLLEDANNFTDEINEVMKLNQDDLFNWQKENMEQYSNSLANAQEQMVQNWEDTFKQMKGIVDLYWDEINKVLASKESFIAYMKESSAYKNASKDEQAQMEYNWTVMYDNFIAASIISPEAEDYKHKDPLPQGTKDTKKKGGSSGNSDNKDSQKDFKNMFTNLKGLTDETITNKFKDLFQFAEGGVVDFTGPAWVDGTKAKPEAFLDAEDTAAIRTMLDMWHYVANKPVVTNLDGLIGSGGSNNSIGDVYVTIQQAELADDADFELVAHKVGEIFTKEIAKQGFQTVNYMF